MSDKKQNVGRPVKFSMEIFEEICRIYANTKQSLEKICNSDSRFPSRDTFYDWKRKDKELSDMYARARIDQIELRIDQIFEEADDDSKDILMGSDGERPNSAAVNRSKLRIDTLKWTASKVIPKVYGDKLELTDSRPKDDRTFSTEQIAEKLNELFNGGRSQEITEGTASANTESSEDNGGEKQSLAPASGPADNGVLQQS